MLYQKCPISAAAYFPALSLVRVRISEVWLVETLGATRPSKTQSGLQPKSIKRKRFAELLNKSNNLFNFLGLLVFWIFSNTGSILFLSQSICLLFLILNSWCVYVPTVGSPDMVNLILYRPLNDLDGLGVFEGQPLI